MKKKSLVIYEGKVKPEISHGGTAFYPKKRRDRFGIILRGGYRYCAVDTKIGQLHLPPYRYGNKKIRITIEEIK